MLLRMPGTIAHARGPWIGGVVHHGKGSHMLLSTKNAILEALRAHSVKFIHCRETLPINSRPRPQAAVDQAQLHLTGVHRLRMNAEAAAHSPALRTPQLEHQWPPKSCRGWVCQMADRPGLQPSCSRGPAAAHLLQLVDGMLVARSQHGQSPRLVWPKGPPNMCSCGDDGEQRILLECCWRLCLRPHEHQHLRRLQKSCHENQHNRCE